MVVNRRHTYFVDRYSIHSCISSKYVLGYCLLYSLWVKSHLLTWHKKGSMINWYGILFVSLPDLSKEISKVHKHTIEVPYFAIPPHVQLDNLQLMSLCTTWLTFLKTYIQHEESSQHLVLQILQKINKLHASDSWKPLARLISAFSYMVSMNDGSRNIIFFWWKPPIGCVKSKTVVTNKNVRMICKQIKTQESISREYIFSCCRPLEMLPFRLLKVTDLTHCTRLNPISYNIRPC